ncbi:hypothetical protein DPV78_011278 [Talaromyces pinophilus]|nr:hypothetical protein DPV78_011278 [Talaromyces pinophilus]
MAEDAEVSTGLEQDARLLKESVILRLPPVSMGTLRSMGFFGVKRELLPRLWKIYGLLIRDKSCKVEDLLLWSEAKVFLLQARRVLGPNSDDVKWLQENIPSWNPEDGRIWTVPGPPWCDCVKRCIGRGYVFNGSDQSLNEIQRAYIAYAVLLLENAPLDPKGVYLGVDIWHEFGFNTCPSQKKQTLKTFYTLALFIRSNQAEKAGEFSAFEAFWQQYRGGTLIPWLVQAIKEDPKQDWPWLEDGIQQEFPWLRFFFPESVELGPTDAKNWSVWRLRQLQEILKSRMRIPEIEVIQAAAKEYGLTKDHALPDPYIDSVSELLDVYVETMQDGPYSLHKARGEGRLASYISSVSRKAKIRVQPWMMGIFNDLDSEQKRKASPEANLATGKHQLTWADTVNKRPLT